MFGQVFMEIEQNVKICKHTHVRYQKSRKLSLEILEKLVTDKRDKKKVAGTSSRIVLKGLLHQDFQSTLD